MVTVHGKARRSGCVDEPRDGWIRMKIVELKGGEQLRGWEKCQDKLTSDASRVVEPNRHCWDKESWKRFSHY